MNLQLQSLIRADGQLELSLIEQATPRPEQPDEVVLRLEAAPINPSDLGLMLAGTDPAQAHFGGSAERPVVTLPVSPAAMTALAGRVDTPLPVGNEGAGTVVAAGSAPEAQALLGRRVAVLAGGGGIPGGTYASHCRVKLAQCLALPEGASAADGASCFVNPLTALGMVETLRQGGYDSMLHTVGASNLGQMLARICRQDGIPLINLVRRPEQAALLQAEGAEPVIDTSAPDFVPRLTDALAVYGTRLAFDPTGGGTLAGQVLAAMEAALLRRSTQPYNRYGSLVHKQVYVYGTLNRGPIELPPGLGFSWSVGGWLLFPFLQQLPPERVVALKQRVADELHTSFASHYAHEIGLAELLTPQALSRAMRMGTGQKTLLRLG